jgi:hypothetical protein
LNVLGVQWPPVKGWKSRLIGQVVSAEVWERFLGLKREKVQPPQLDFTAGLLEDDETEDATHAEGEHPDDREAYEVFARAMGWEPEWWELGTERDIPGPGRKPFILAFRRVRELAGTCRIHHVGSTVDHWAEWLKLRERQKAERAICPARRGRRADRQRKS